MPYTSKAVANYFLDLAENNGKTVDPLQIQKLVYFSQGWHLALTDRSLIKEIIQAWPYGPVIPALFHEFKRWGNAPIRERASDFALVDRKPTGGIVFGKRVYSLDAEATDDEHLVVDKKIIQRIWEVYGGFSGLRLSQMTHQPDSPWAIVRRASPGSRDIDIPNDVIKGYFKRRIQRNVPAAEHAIIAD